MKFKKYVVDRLFSILCLAGTQLLIWGFLWLIETPLLFVLLVEGIILAAFVIVFLHDYGRRSRYYGQLWKILEQLEQKTLLDELLAMPDFLDGQILTEVLHRSNKYQNDRIAEVEQKNQEYREYLDSWVHEIKTPITSARLIIENDKNATTLRIDDELRKIDGFVEQVLYYARSSAVEKDFRVEKITLQELVNASLKTYSKPLIQASGKPVFENLQLIVCGDKKSCVFVIGQIVSNAIKYRGDQLQITFSAREEKERTLLVISDNGIGIPPGDLPHIFEKGFTGEIGRRYSKSTGIGLYLCKRLCSKMNMELSVQSVQQQGTTVTISFPGESYLREAGL